MPLSETFPLFHIYWWFISGQWEWSWAFGASRIQFERLEQNGLVVNPAKCQFGCIEIDFLGPSYYQTGNYSSSSKSASCRRVPQAHKHQGGYKNLLGWLTSTIDFYHILLKFCFPCTKPSVKTENLLRRSHGPLTWIVLLIWTKRY